MIDAQTFASELSIFQKSLYLKRVYSSTIYTVVQEANTSFEALQLIHNKNLSANDLEKELRLFLKKRGEYIQRSEADYLSMPHSPINRLCIKLLQKFIKKDESLIKILMPGISIENYDLAGSNLIALTETTGQNGERDLAYSRFILSEGGRSVIPILEWFREKIRRIDQPFNHCLYTVDEKMVPLTKGELYTLMQSILPYSEELYAELHLKDAYFEAPETLANALKELIKHLNENEGGTHEVAGPVAMLAIRKFLTIWYQLPDEVRKQLGGLEDSHNRTLASRLLLLESGVNDGNFWKEHQELSEAYTCVGSTATCLSDILYRHTKKLGSIILDKNNVQNAVASLPRRPLEDYLPLLEQTISAQEVNIRRAIESSDPRVKATLNQHSAYQGRDFSDQNSRFKYEMSVGLTQTPITCLSHIDIVRSIYPELLGKKLSEIPQTNLYALMNEAIYGDGIKSGKVLLRYRPEGLTQLSVDLILQDPVGKRAHAIVDLLGEKLPPMSDEQAKILFNKALNEGWIKILRLVIKSHPGLLHMKYGLERTPLHRACQIGFTPIVSLIIEQLDDLNAIDLNGQTALHIAVKQKHRDIILLLLEKGADVKVVDKFGKSALDHYLSCITSRSQYVIAEFVRRGAKFNPSVPGSHPLVFAFDQGWTDVIDALLERGFNLNEQNSDGYTLLNSAILDGKSDLVKFLMSKGAKLKPASASLLPPVQPNAARSRGITPMTMPFDSNTIVPGTLANVLDYAIEKGTIGRLCSLVPSPESKGVRELLGMKSLDRLITELNLANVMSDKPEIQLAFYAGATVCRLESAQPGKDPNFWLKRSKALRLREAMTDNNPESIFRALKMHEVQSFFWTTNNGTSTMPESLRRYERELRQNTQRSGCLPFS